MQKKRLPNKSICIFLQNILAAISFLGQGGKDEIYLNYNLNNLNNHCKPFEFIDKCNMDEYGSFKYF